MTEPLPLERAPIVFTNKARCRDCYKCLRACPVKAIRMRDGQAYVVDEECIRCGTCVRECPQGAKHVRDDVPRAMALLASGRRVAVSVAPSFAGMIDAAERPRLPSALRRLGFGYVAETAVAAYAVAQLTARHVDEHPAHTHLTSCCPAVVSYVEARHPTLVPSLVPVASPMLAHAAHLRRTLGPEWGVVFVGPCVAKKAEAERAEHEGLVDVVLTFDELFQWLERRGITLAGCEESAFDETPEGDARVFALPGGLAQTAGKLTAGLDGELLTVAGLEALDAALADLTPTSRGLVEPLFCVEGCVGGPAMRRRAPFRARAEVLRYARQATRTLPFRELRAAPARFVARGATPAFPEDAIRTMLASTGREAHEDQLDCGACGYASCRDKAIAVLRGMAEREICVPYMRRLAEQRTDRIIETSPNGILILDRHLRVLAMNPAFRRLFVCGDAVLGKEIAYLMDPEPFQRIARGETELVEATVNHQSYGLVCHEIIYPLRSEQQVVGIFVNLTQTREAQRRLEQLRSETMVGARDLLEHQVRMAQRIAQLLGESTAQSETLVTRLLELAAGGDLAAKPGGPWDRSR